MLSYKAIRRKAASLLNGYLMPKLGVKIVRSFPKNFRYEKLATQDGLTTLRVRGSTAAAPVELQLREGTSDWLTFDQIFVDEDYDLRPLPRYGEIAALYERICRRGTPLIVDLGGNIGLSALYFHMVWPKAHVVTVEPDAQNFELLSANVARIGPIDAIRAGAASKASTLRIVDPSVGKNAFRTEVAHGPAADGVSGVTVGSILDRYCRDQGCIPFIAKVDIEGAEAELFSGDCDWIDEFPLLSIELHDWLFPGQRTSQSFLKAISGRDRDFVYVDENIFSIKNGLAADALRADSARQDGVAASA